MRAPLSQYEIKIYNKGLQYSQPINILRFEKKVVKMTNIIKGGILFLSELMKRGFAEKCLQELMRCFEETVVTEKINTKLLTNAELKIYEIDINPRYWGQASRKQKHKYKPLFTSIIDRLGMQKLKAITRMLLQQKDLEIINC